MYNRSRKLDLMMVVSANPGYKMEWYYIWVQGEIETNMYLVYTMFDRVTEQVKNNYIHMEPSINQLSHHIVPYIYLYDTILLVVNQIFS